MAEIEVQGMRQFRRELKKLGNKGLTDALKDEHQKVAQDVVDQAQRNATKWHSRALEYAASSYRAARTVNGAVVRGGSAAIPWAGAAEFGAEHNVTRYRRTGSYVGYNQFMTPLKGGFTIYPAIWDLEEQISRTYISGIDRALRDAFPD